MKKEIGKLLFKKIFLYYLLVATILTILQIYHEYTTQRDSLTSSLHNASNIFYEPLVNVIWSLDENQIVDTSQSIMSMDGIVGMSIIDPENIIISQYGTVANTEKGYNKYSFKMKKVLYKDDLLQHSFPIVYKENSSEVLANVTLYASSEKIYINIKERVIIIILVAMTKSLALFFLFLFFSNKMITQPLKRLIDEIKKTESENHEHTNACIIDHTQSSEFAVLFDRYNDMQVRIDEEMKKNKAFGTLFEHSSDGLLVMRNGKIVQCNKTALSMLGIGNKNILFDLDPLNISSNLQPDGKKSDEKAMEMINLAVKNGKHEFEWMHTTNSGHDLWICVTLNSITLHDGNVIYVSLRDITNKKSDEIAILDQKVKFQHQAYHDQLTKLPNRIYLDERLEQAISKSKRHKTKLAVLFIDLDKFKPINDSLGHAVGDKVLQEVSSRLKSAIRKEDTLARLGGDEFIILIEEFIHKEDLSSMAQNIVNILTEPINIGEYVINISSSIGISTCPKDDDTAHNLLKYADMAMYKAKDSGRNNFQFYSIDLSNHS